ncbi:MAG: flavin reductase family protein [Pyrinomonadaceae bacterium]
MISKHEFRHALSRFASGVTVVTTKDANGHSHGITVSAFCSLSLAPPLILICIDKHTGSHHAFEENEFFVVNILREDQQHYSDQFASHLPDKFDGIKFHENDQGIPVLENVLSNLECRRVNSHDDGDHTIYVGEIERATISDGKPLVYFHGNYRKLES